MKAAYYRCVDHGRVPVSIRKRAPDTSPCPSCGRSMPRASEGSESRVCVHIAATTRARLKAHAEREGVSVADVIDALAQQLGGAP
jgi:hypothetical protein